MSSSSVSMNDGISTSNTLVKKRYLLFNVMIILTSIFPVSFWFASFFWGRLELGLGNFFMWYDFFYIPLVVFGIWISFSMLMIINTRIIVGIINLFCKPKEGVFPRLKDENGKYNRDFRYWSLRHTVMKNAIWAAHFYPLPWIDIVVFKIFGIKCNVSTTLMDSWISIEFIEFGENTLIGSTSVVLSSVIAGDKLIIKKIKVGRNVVIGGASIVSPGTTIEDNVMLGARSITKIGQTLESGWIYFGNPCTKLRPNKLSENLNYKTTEIGDANKKEQYQLDVAQGEKPKENIK